MHNLIAVHGKIGSGKDTVADMIMELYPGTYTKKKFADKLKDIICIMIGCTREQLEDQEFKKTPLGKEWWVWKNKKGELYSYNFNELRDDPKKREIIRNKPEFFGFELLKYTPRRLLTLVGSDLGAAQIHPNMWINALFSGWEQNSNWVISDLRFPDEKRVIDDRRGITIKVVRPTAITDCMSEFTKQHISETALDHLGDDQYDHVIYNDGTLDDLHQKVKDIFDE